MKIRAFLVVALGVISSIANGQVIDKTSGGAYKRIIIAADAPGSVRMAASDLQEYLKAVCKADLAIKNTTKDKTGNIYVGFSSELKKQGFSQKCLKPDAFNIVSRNGNLYIWGRDYSGGPITGIRNPWRYPEVYNSKLHLGAFGEAGTMYGVYYFLEKFAGVRWYMPSELGTVITKKNEIGIPALHITKSPDFEYRYAWLCDFEQAPENALWFRRTGFGGLCPTQIIDSFVFFLKYKKSHPEYFALVDGKRDFGNKCASRGGGHLCLTNPDVAKQWVKDICAYFKANPAQKVFPLVPNDGLTRICGCAKCQTELDHKAAESGKFSNHIWNFVNKVAIEVNKEHPDKFVGCIAYEKYLDPPSNIRKLSPNVAVMICQSRCYLINSAGKQNMRKKITAWHAKCQNLYTWEYYLQSWMPWRNLPIVFPHIISEDLKYLKKIGSKGEFIEAESWYGNRPHKMLFPGMQHINLYVTGKLYWDVDQDIDKLLNEYFKLFYGPAEIEMKEFWQLAEKNWNDAGKIKSRLTPTVVFSKSTLDQLSTLLKKAEMRTRAGTIYRKRVQLVAKEFQAGRRTISRVLRKKTPVLAVPVTHSRMQIDGLLSESIYKKIEPQIFVDKTGEAASYKTYLYVACDTENLYFAFINYDPDTKNLKSRCTKKDTGMIWMDDCIELFISSNPKNRKCTYQFIVNAKGVTWDGRHGFSKDGRVDIAWNSGIKAATIIQENRWILEVKIPLQDLGITGSAARQGIAANFYRSRISSGGQVFSCWSPIVENKHLTPKRFGILNLSEIKQ